MRSSTFRNVGFGVLALAAAYHLGARAAVAQAPYNAVVGFTGDGSGLAAVTTNGDVYRFGMGGPAVWNYQGNVFGTPTPATPATLGEIKSRYR